MLVDAKRERGVQRRRGSLEERLRGDMEEVRACSHCGNLKILSIGALNVLSLERELLG